MIKTEELNGKEYQFMSSFDHDVSTWGNSVGGNGYLNGSMVEEGRSSFTLARPSKAAALHDPLKVEVNNDDKEFA